MAKRTETTAKKSFLKSGGHAGAAFMAGLIKTVTAGQVGSGFAMAATKLKPQMAHAGGALGVALAAGIVTKLALSLQAMLPAAIGGAIVAGPLIYLWKTQEKAVDRLKKKAEDFMHTISRPFKVPFLESLQLVGRTLENWGPKVRKALAPLAKELPGVVKNALKGIENFAEQIDLEKVRASFRAWGREIPRIGRALGRMVDAWMGDAETMDESVQDVADSFVKMADAIGDVGRAFRRFNKVNDQFVEMREQWRESALSLRASMLGAMADVAEGLNKLGLLPKRTAKHFRAMATQAEADLAGLRNSMRKTDNQKVIPKIKADKRDLESKLRAAKAELRRVDGTKAEPAVRANIRHLQTMVRIAKAQLASIRNRTVTITAFYRSKGTGPTSAGRLETGGIVGGGLSRPAAEGGARGRQVLVGEHGPEIVDLPMGSHVNSNPDSQRMMATSRKGGGDTYITVNAPNYVGSQSDLIRALVDAKRRGQLDVVFR